MNVEILKTGKWAEPNKPWVPIRELKAGEIHEVGKAFSPELAALMISVEKAKEVETTAAPAPAAATKPAHAKKATPATADKKAAEAK